jgi:exosortase/archaeosortase family protein
MILLGSAILATRGEKAYSRIRGALVGVVALYLFNLLRMVITLLQIEHSPMDFAAFTHDVLFRLILIVGFALVYGAWLQRKQIHEWAGKKALF